MATRILIADDSPIVRQCLGRLLCGHTDWEVCGEATDGEDAVCKTRELNPDLVVLDFLMPRKNGIDAAREIGKLSPKTPILLCTIFFDPGTRRLGARGGRCGDPTQGRTEQGRSLRRNPPARGILLFLQSSPASSEYLSQYLKHTPCTHISSQVYRSPPIARRPLLHYIQTLNPLHKGGESSCGALDQGTQQKIGPG